jgi:hypothetical protein
LETGALPIELLAYNSIGEVVSWKLGDVKSPMHQSTHHQLLRLFVRRVLPAEPAELAHLEPFRRFLLVLGRAVVTTLALGAGHRNDVSHNCLLEMGEWGNW